MPTFHSGVGGSITVDATELEVTSWTATKEIELAEVTNSGSGGWRERKGTIKSMSGSVEVPWDSEAIPDTDLSLDVGDEITALVLTMGDSAKFYSLPAIVKSVQPTVNSQGDIVRMTISWESNGAVTDPVT